MTTYACLMLPMPPSVNALYGTNWNTRQRFPSKAYEDWKIEAQVALYEQAPLPSIKGPVNVIYTFGRTGNRKKDCFNFEKAVSDLLGDEKYQIIEDDSLIDRGTVQWADDADGFVGCRVEVEAAG